MCICNSLGEANLPQRRCTTGIGFSAHTRPAKRCDIHTQDPCPEDERKRELLEEIQRARDAQTMEDVDEAIREALMRTSDADTDKVRFNAVAHTMYTRAHRWRRM
jgi:hypothetical protein